MYTYLEKRDHTKREARFYRLAVLSNLFGEWTLERWWGRIGQGGHRNAIRQHQGLAKSGIRLSDLHCKQRLDDPKLR
jgi:predicted DNA-binding WGR domain protein